MRFSVVMQGASFDGGNGTRIGAPLNFNQLWRSVRLQCCPARQPRRGTRAPRAPAGLNDMRDRSLAADAIRPRHAVPIAS